jgi:prophage regulatory protein
MEVTVARKQRLDGETRMKAQAETSPIPVDKPQTAATVLRFPAVRARTGLSRTTVWRLEQRGEFPRHLNLSSHIVGWLESDIAAWIRARGEGVEA